MIIGLLVGGVLVGRDLIQAAEIRAQISQIEKYNTATHTFKLKYGYLPGDIPDPTASAFGFKSRNIGQANGNGMISGGIGNVGQTWGWVQTGKPQMFWVDLSTAGLIDGGFSAASPSDDNNTGCLQPISSYYPTAKIAGGIFVYVNSAYNTVGVTTNTNYNHDNFFSISQVQSLKNGSWCEIIGVMGIAVKQTYNIDVKIDDGLPISGKVTAVASGLSSSGAGFYGTLNFANGEHIYNLNILPGGSAINPSSLTCYDNSNNAINPIVYSMSQNGGNGMNCALSFKFQ